MGSASYNKRTRLIPIIGYNPMIKLNKGLHITRPKNKKQACFGGCNKIDYPNAYYKDKSIYICKGCLTKARIK